MCRGLKLAVAGVPGAVRVAAVKIDPSECPDTKDSEDAETRVRSPGVCCVFWRAVFALASSVPSNSGIICTLWERSMGAENDMGETSSCICKDDGVGGGTSFADVFVAELSVLSRDVLNNETGSSENALLDTHWLIELTHRPRWHVWVTILEFSSSMNPCCVVQSIDCHNCFPVPKLKDRYISTISLSCCKVTEQDFRHRCSVFLRSSSSPTSEFFEVASFPKF